ncbi:hypothetical protein Aglo03_05730 [Actinokineospora globicatena]|uniref:Uncharacterized protein n=1 Tax=Actinokineospora globicatena TaxID=103729 RepID=A0A9W6QHX6_9PSEU|nr:hypothetical protein Aglo03_05730 [Actinokineospora globicatena]
MKPELAVAAAALTQGAAAQTDAERATFDIRVLVRRANRTTTRLWSTAASCTTSSPWWPSSSGLPTDLVPMKISRHLDAVQSRRAGPGLLSLMPLPSRHRYQPRRLRSNDDRTDGHQHSR